MKKQYAGSLTQQSVRATFADSLSQYSKHSDDANNGGNATEVEVVKNSKISIKGIYSNKQTKNSSIDKF